MRKAFLILILLPSLAHSATLFLKTAGGTWGDASTWSNVNAGGVDNSGPPLITDDTVAELLSGNVTVDKSTDVCRSFSATGGTGSWTGTLTHNAAITWVIGSTLTFSTGMTYARGGATTSATSFLGNNSTGTITTAGKVMGNTSFGGAGANFILFDSWVSTNSGQITTFSSGSLHIDGAANNSGLSPTVGNFITNNSNSRYLFLGTSSMTVANAGVSWSINPLTGLTTDVNTSTINFIGANVSPNFGGQNMNGASVRILGGGTTTMSAGTNIGTFRSFTVTGTAVKTDTVVLAGDMTITGTTSINGNSAINRIILQTSTIGTQRTITNAATVDSSTNIDFRDIALSSAKNLSAITGNSGDCGGNSGITFTSADTETFKTAAGGSWSNVANWLGASATRVPLPQDNVSLNRGGNYNTAAILVLDMPRAGHTIDATGATWTGTAPSVQASGVSPIVYGAITMIPSFAFLSGTWIFEGRNTALANATSSTMPVSGWPFTSAGNVLTMSLTFQPFGGIYQLQDMLSASNFALNAGSFDANVSSATIATLTSNTAILKSLKMGTQTWSITGTGNAWNMSGVTNITVTPSTSLISFTNVSSTAKNFLGGGQTFNDISISSSAANGNTTFTGNNTFRNFSVGNPKTIILTAASTQTVSGSFSAIGVSGSSVTITSSIVGTKAFLNYTAGGAICGNDYMSIQDNQGTPQTGTWYAGPNGTLVSNTVGWTASACPVTATGNAFWFGEM